MLLQPVSIYTVPEQTARVARVAFPHSSLCMRLYDQLGTIFEDQDFADLYSQHGQPGQAVGTRVRQSPQSCDGLLSIFGSGLTAREKHPA